MWKSNCLANFALAFAQNSEISQNSQITLPIQSTPIRGPSYKRTRTNGDSGEFFIDYDTQVSNFQDFNINHLSDRFHTETGNETWQFWSQNGTKCAGFSLCAVNDQEIMNQGFSGACLTDTVDELTTACYNGDCSNELAHVVFKTYDLNDENQMWTFEKSTQQLRKLNTTLCLTILSPNSENFDQENGCSEFYSPPEFLGGGYLFTAECSSPSTIDSNLSKNQQWVFKNGLIKSACPHEYHISAAHPFVTVAKNDKDSNSNLARFGDEIDITVQLVGEESAFSTILEIYLTDPVVLTDVLMHGCWCPKLAGALNSENTVRSKTHILQTFS